MIHGARLPLRQWWDRYREKAKKAAGEGLMTPPPLSFPRDVQESILHNMRLAYAHGWANGYRLVQTLYRMQTKTKARPLVVKLDEAAPPGWESSARVADAGSALTSFARAEPAVKWRDVIPEEAVSFLNSYVPQLAGVLEQACLAKVSEAIAESMTLGLTVPERAMMVSGALEDLRDFPIHRLNAIARTESMRAYSLGNLSTMARLHSHGGYVEGVEFSAILDDRTSEICRRRNGLRMRLDDPKLPDNTPPLHPNCRSVLIPIVWGEGEAGWETDSGWQGAMNEDPATMRDSDIRAVRDILRAVRSL
jgi:SPP1 gp7 family putative phage head morphogenesis protein